MTVNYKRRVSGRKKRSWIILWKLQLYWVE